MSTLNITSSGLPQLPEPGLFPDSFLLGGLNYERQCYNVW